MSPRLVWITPLLAVPSVVNILKFMIPLRGCLLNTPPLGRGCNAGYLRNNLPFPLNMPRHLVRVCLTFPDKI